MSLKHVLRGKEIVLQNPDPSDSSCVISSVEPISLNVNGNDVLSLNDTDNEVSMANNFYAKEFGGGTHVEIGNAAASSYSFLINETGYLIINAPGIANCTQMRVNGASKFFVCDTAVKTDATTELQVLNTTNATSAGSGCCILSGGLGAAGDIYSGYGHIKTVYTDQVEISTTDRDADATYALRLVDSDGNYYNVPTGFSHVFRVNNNTTAIMNIAAAQIDVNVDIDFNGNDHIGESDERTKENIALADLDFLKIVDSCPVHSYNYKAEYTNNQSNKIGIIAQHLEQAEPSLVKTVVKKPICRCGASHFSSEPCECEKKGTIEDCRVLEQQKIIYTLWGAVRQLSAKVEAMSKA